MKRNSILKSVVLAVVVSMVGTQPALAYLDPNTGGLLFQLLAVIFAFFSAMLLLFSAQIRMAFARVKRFLRNVRRKLFSG